MVSQIHPTAVIDPAASIGADVQIGPYCVVGPNVSLGDRVRLVSHVCVDGHTTIGEETVIFPFSSIGHAPQDLKYKGEASTLEIGARNRIREHVTMNPGTEDGGMKTVVGNDGLFMVGAHVAHDCIVGNNVILANNATLAGHVELGDFAIIGGLSAVHQFVRIGPHAMIGGMSGVEHDVIPYGLVMGDRARLQGLNLVGLERRGFDRGQIKVLRGLYQDMFSDEGTMQDRINRLAETHKDNDLAMAVINFALNRASRALCQPSRG